jgi:hypothetical protein
MMRRLKSLMRKSESFFGLITDLGITEVVIDLITTITYFIGVYIILRMTLMDLMFGVPVVIISLYLLRKNMN